MMKESSARQELAVFLRTRRERIRPQDVGLPVRGKRRTTGLRREEVAQLAGIGVTWYTWLEQGRDVRPSAAVVAALSEALRLSEAEQAHLVGLIRRHEAATVRMPSGPLKALCSYIPSPAYVRDGTGDLLTWNESARAFFSDFGPKLKGNANLLIYMFLNEQSRWTFKDWADVASRSVAQFRRVNGASTDGTRAALIVGHLKDNSPEFCEMWDTFQVTHPYIGQRILRDRSGKESVFSYATLTSPHAPSPWITMYIPIRH